MQDPDTAPNGRGRLEEAVATLVQSQTVLNQSLAVMNQNQVAFVSQLADINRAHAELERKTEARFARIEAQMAEIIRVLNEHGRLLERLPEAVRDKIGARPGVATPGRGQP